MGPLNLIPWGFGNFLGLKGDEGLLKQISDFVQPVIDVTQIFGGPNARENISQVLNVNAVGFNPAANLTVPANECWFVRGSGFSGVTLAGEILRAKLAAFGTQGQGLFQVTDEGSSSLTDAVGVSNFAAYQRIPGFFLYPAEGLAVNISKITTAGNIAVSASATILRFHS
jgi:hypothetical protein